MDRSGRRRRSANVPLGWVLAQSTRQRMEAQLTREQCVAAGSEPIFDNPANLKKIDAQFAPRASSVRLFLEPHLVHPGNLQRSAANADLDGRTDAQRVIGFAGDLQLDRLR